MRAIECPTAKYRIAAMSEVRCGAASSKRYISSRGWIRVSRRPARESTRTYAATSGDAHGSNGGSLAIAARCSARSDLRL